MKRLLLGAAALMITGNAYAGGQLDETKILGPSSAVPGSLDAELVPIFWDDRCTSISYTLDTIPATGVAGPIPPAVLRVELQESFDKWNQVNTSYIEMNVDQVRTIGNGVRSFDFINELTWETAPGAGFLASSPSTALIQDADLLVGDDIDGDGDSDVFDPAVEGRNTCFDADADGDIEFPAGFYTAGTILDNDVQFNDFAFNPATFPIAWETEPSSTLPGQVRATDIQSVATHEFGHSHSLSHSMINQISKNDGTGSTMFPFIDIDDAASEEGQRSLHTDDIAWTSYVYPEGSNSSGPGALQSGDVAFSSVFDVIHGTIKQDGFGVLGGNVQAINKGNGRRVGEAYSGRAQLPITPDLAFFDLVSIPYHVLDAEFDLPVPRGVYDLTIEALDGDPAAGGNISLTAFVGELLGQHTYAEEFRGSPGQEDEDEDDPSQSFQTISFTGVPTPNIVTNEDVVLRNAGALTNIGTGAAIGVDDVIYAERFDREDLLPLLDDKAKITTGLFRTGVFDASTVGVFKSAGIYVGTVNPDGTATIELDDPLQKVNEFVGQDGDLTPLFFERTAQLSKQVEKALKRNDKDVFLVLEAKNNPVVGDSGNPPLLGLAVEPASGHSYLSVEGGPFNPRGSNWIVEMRLNP